ncbi:uncharacterized protein LOC141899780 [Tubulanus polymorphus]|uniref:uncharacterized protein LOC141899780 n=1 Tax=Tubulanus polymorphus TaxID=672921 RepID=UPI003DA24AD4
MRPIRSLSQPDAVTCDDAMRSAKRSVDHISDDVEFQIGSFYGAKKLCMQRPSEHDNSPKVLGEVKAGSLPNSRKRNITRAQTTKVKEISLNEGLDVKENSVGNNGKKFFKHRTKSVQRASFQLIYHKQNSKGSKKRNNLTAKVKHRRTESLKAPRKKHSFAELEFYADKKKPRALSTDNSEPPMLMRQTDENVASASIDIPPVLSRECLVEVKSDQQPVEICGSTGFGVSDDDVDIADNNISTDNPEPMCNNVYSQDLFTGEFSSNCASSCASSLSENNDNLEVNSSTDIVDGLVVPASNQTVLNDNTNVLNIENKLPPAIIDGKKCYPIFSPRNSPIQTTLRFNTDDSPGSRKSTPRRQTLLKSLREDGKEQMILDFGQKEHVTIECPTCGMIYTEKEPEDEAAHSRFHQRFLNALRYTGWKKERVVQEFSDGKIVLLSYTDKTAQKKIASILKVVDDDLGFSEMCDQSQKANKRIYIYVNDEKRVVGCCVAEPISQACRVLAGDDKQEIGKAWCCSTEMLPCRCGISRVWVFKHARRKGIATRLLDCLRFNFVLGYPLSKANIAFTDPTADGKLFATSYTGSKEFLVYK